MARQFDIPTFYKSAIISRVKRARQAQDSKKRDLLPSVLDFGPVRFLLARHFGFCFGVENAIEIAYKTLDEHGDKRIFFLSEMIHNPNVNADLQDRGVKFIFTPEGEQLVDWDFLTAEDIVVVPAFGTTIETQAELSSRGIDPYTYNTTCPFVEKVWKRSAQLGEGDHTVIIHGKASHEETRATFSHTIQNARAVVVLDLKEAHLLADVIRGKLGVDAFDECFGYKCSEGFDSAQHLSRIGVVNQTTMLASETREIAQVIRQALVDRYGADQIEAHFADTSDTLCYATNENQNATYSLIEQQTDLALVVGGYNSSNTSHIVELCEAAMPTYFVKNASELISEHEIQHFSLAKREVITQRNWLPEKRPLSVALTCGASCPDAVVDDVLLRVLSFFEEIRAVDDVLQLYPPLDIEPA
ncbi:MAG: 4-hydroxy-3-methylbut-2-enyl diphosphate reductase [Candidatus Latescibacteria bacterium]|jgi:4-hydroxy-3-methylbut-2-en-1-yl diphosphate reductase|nr:4-hydroxy-3-methylbut-2-enyl diphosphate reductase [Candidatus Latescibacterota bacterium]MBT5831953.1 4-hydroxy-3-methylbut-2-enyl diphosphate reductase [Candidatus Latescibacterota bacterium]